MKYVTTKIIKRMDDFKVRGGTKDKQRKILLPLSFGTCSITLLHILDQQLRIQLERTNRTGYELHILFVDHASASGQLMDAHFIDLIKNKYPLNMFSTLLLEDIFNYQFPPDELNAFSIIDTHEQSDVSEMKSNTERLKTFLASLPSITSQTDLVNVLRTRVIVEFAKANGCECIAWGDSATRLAEKTLSETAKGRGYSLPWQTCEGLSPYGVTFNFPMRDLLRKEIVTYSSMTYPPLEPLIVPQQAISQSSISSKNMTIDDLMGQYFGSVEENYPSIVANVVRTSSKLQTPGQSSESITCKICELPVDSQSQGLHGWGGNQEDILNGSSTQKSSLPQDTVYCYGCARSVFNEKEFLSRSG